VLGDPRTNQHPPLLALGILFYRYHNVIATRVQREHPDMSDEEIFQKARRIVVGTIQVTNRLFLSFSRKCTVGENYSPLVIVKEVTLIKMK